MKRYAFLYTAFALLAVAAALLGFMLGKRNGNASCEGAAAFAPISVPEPSAEPSSPVRIEPASARPTREPALPKEDFLVLVNLENPIFEEPPVVNISERLTAGNVFCDERRHANETAILALNEMLLAAEREGSFEFIIASAFRSIEEQTILWETKLLSDPAHGSDPYFDPVKVMPPNCSEHTTGLAFDILCSSCPHSDLSFAYTAEGGWLRENCARFGFILRYPEGKESITGVQYEPWHFRYVGAEAAQEMNSAGLCLEEYIEGSAPN